MSKIVNYEILLSGHINDLENDVNEAIKKGWEPLGSVVVKKNCFYQTMIMKQEVSLSQNKISEAGEDNTW